MKHKFQMDESNLMMKLNKEYGINIESFSFIPVGDSAYSYRVNSVSGERFYLKLFDHGNDSHLRGIERLKAYLPLTWSLFHQGLFRNLTYPIRTLNEEFTVSLSDCTVVLFHFIEGETLASAYPFSDKILRDIGESAAQIHLLTPCIDPSILLTENYDISFTSDLEKSMVLLESAETFDDPIQQSVKKHVLANKNNIIHMLGRLHGLRAAALTDPKEMVLCHGDLWGGNLIYADDELYLIDWESALIAPPELDLAGYAGDEFGTFISAYEQKLGQSVKVNPDILRFYSYRHHLRNLTNWLMNILYRNVGQEQKENDLDMILYHCMNRWDDIEPKIHMVESILRNRTGGNG